MTQEEILEGNKLIAQFMGETLLPIKEGDLYPIITCTTGLKQTRYHASWDWLMPVVEKIESFDNSNIDSRVSIERNTCSIYYDNRSDLYEFNAWNDGWSKIQITYSHIVEFIKWYNENKDL